MTQTNSPLFDSFTEEQNQRYLRWTTFSDCKSKVLTELNKKLPSVRKSGYSCNMIIVDDVVDELRPFPASDGQDPMQKLLDDYKNWHDKKIAEMFRIPENAIVATGTANISDSMISSEIFDKELVKTWGQNYD